MGYPTFSGRPTQGPPRPGGDVNRIAKLIPSVRLSAPYHKPRTHSATIGATSEHVSRIPSRALSASTSLATPVAVRVDELPSLGAHSVTRSAQRKHMTVEDLGDDDESIKEALAPSQRHLLQHQARYTDRVRMPDGTATVSTGHGYVSSVIPREQARQQDLLIQRMRRERDHATRRLTDRSPAKSLPSTVEDGQDELDMSRTTTHSEEMERIRPKSVTATRLIEAVNCDGALHLCSQSNHWIKVNEAKEENLRLRTLQRMTASSLTTQLEDQARLQATAAGYSQRHGEVAMRKLQLLETKLVGSFEKFLVNQHGREIAKHAHESRLLNARTKEWLAPIVFALTTRRLIQSVRIARAKDVLRRLFVGRFLSYLRKTKSRQLRAETVLAHEASIIDVPPLEVLRNSVPAMARLPEPLLQALLQPMYPPPSRRSVDVLGAQKTVAPPEQQRTVASPQPQDVPSPVQQPLAVAGGVSYGPNNILAPRPPNNDSPTALPSPVGCGVLERRCFLPEEFISYAGEPGDLCYILYRGAIECPSETSLVRAASKPSNGRGEANVRGTTSSEDGGPPQTDLTEIALNYRRQLAYAARLQSRATSRNAPETTAIAEAVLAAPPLITARWSVVCHSTLWTADPYEHTFRAASHKAVHAAERVLTSPDAIIDLRPPSPWLFSLPPEEGNPPVSESGVGGADFWVIRLDKFAGACQRYFADQKINLKALRTLVDQQQLSAANRRRRQSMTSDAGTDLDSAVESEGHSDTKGEGKSTAVPKGGSALTQRLAAARSLMPSDPVMLQALERQLESIAAAGQWHIRVADAHRERIMLRHRSLTPETVRKASQLFAKFSVEGVRMLIQAAKPVVCRRDDVIIKPGQYGRRVLVVVAGRLEVLLDRRKRLQVLTEGSCVGDTAAALGKKDPRVSVRALASSDVWQIDHKDLDMIVVREDPAMLMTIAVTALDETGSEKVYRGV